MRGARPALAVALALVLAACTTGGNPTLTPSPAGAPIPRGGTLVTGIYNRPPAFDPQTDYSGVAWELFRCCLLRTLLSYNGMPADEGGAELRPDLATSLPQISDDGRTWTFHLNPGINYAPPLQDQEIVAGDFVRALQRMASTSVNPKSSPSYAFYYSVIDGFDAARRGASTSISGLEVPNDSTLVVHLTHPDGDLGYLFSLSATAPIPAYPDDPSAPLGVATGHDDDYGRYLVASGPYMYEGSEKLDFARPPSEQTPVRGLVPAVPGGIVSGWRHGSLTLVRNPSWDPATDRLRPAYVDRIHLLVGDVPGETTYPEGAVKSGLLDLMFTPNAYWRTVRAYEANPSRAGLVQRDETGGVAFMTMNLAQPPFDNLHARKAVSLAVDQQRVLQIFNESFIPGPGVAARHMAPDSMEDSLLASYRSTWAEADPTGNGDLTRARAEMRLSGYDSNGDGLCDADACKGVRLLAFDDRGDPGKIWTRVAAAIRARLQALGIGVRIVHLPDPTLSERATDPNGHVALALQAWFPDFPSSSNIFANMVYGPRIGDPTLFDATLMGASADQLAAYGYATTSVPSVDEQIDRCSALVGQAQVTCWADLDQYLMETVVPWVPLEFTTAVRTLSTRVVNFSFDQFTGLPALDRIALALDGG